MGDEIAFEKGMYDLMCVPHFDFIELSEDSIRVTDTNLLNITLIMT